MAVNLIACLCRFVFDYCCWWISGTQNLLSHFVKIHQTFKTVILFPSQLTSWYFWGNIFVTVENSVFSITWLREHGKKNFETNYLENHKKYGQSLYDVLINLIGNVWVQTYQRQYLVITNLTPDQVILNRNTGKGVKFHTLTQSSFTAQFRLNLNMFQQYLYIL